MIKNESSQNPDHPIFCEAAEIESDGWIATYRFDLADGYDLHWII